VAIFVGDQLAGEARLDAANAEIERFTIDTPQLRTAAAMLGVVLSQ
jgi:hypothetical protein